MFGYIAIEVGITLNRGYIKHYRQNKCDKHRGGNAAELYIAGEPHTVSAVASVGASAFGRGVHRTPAPLCGAGYRKGYRLKDIRPAPHVAT